MIGKFNIKTIRDVHIENKTVLVRVDYNVPLTPEHTITNDERIQQTLPTLRKLLKHHNRLILISHLGQPKGKDKSLSLAPIARRLQQMFSDYEVLLIKDFTKPAAHELLARQTRKQILLLENLRFYAGEKDNNPIFAKGLAGLADAYVNDAFSVCHREDASVVGMRKYLPSYGGLLLEKEITAISQVMNHPKDPVVVILGGAKVSTKLPLLFRLTEIADYILLGGGLANTFLKNHNIQVGKSVVEPHQKTAVKELQQQALKHHTTIMLPQDVVCAETPTSETGEVFQLHTVPKNKIILDIGPETQAIFGKIINQAKTIIWNGPVGFFENPAFARGTEFIYYAITENPNCFSLIGGGDTITAVAKQEHLDKISHISTGGGAMLEFIEKGTLPGIQALERTTKTL